MYAKNGLIAPKYWNHDSNLKNNDGYTVAMLLANKGVVPPKQWEHDSSM